MKTLMRNVLVIAGIVAATGSLSSSAKADPPQTANSEQEGRSHFLRGVEFSRDGDFRAALIEFRRAYSVAPNYRVLYNIGQTALELQEYVQALDALEKYLVDGASEIPAARRAEVEAEIQRLQHRISQVTVTVSVPNATILLDDVAVGTSPLEHPLRVGPGRHKFSAMTPDIPVVARLVDVAAGERSTVEIELRQPEKSPVIVPASMSGQNSEPIAPPSRTAVWVGLGVTGALAIGTAVAGVVSLSAKSSFEDALGNYPGDASRVRSTRDSLKTTALVFDILAVSTIVAGVTTVAIQLFSPRHPSAASASSGPSVPRRFLNSF